jgi:hypothetical protein
MKATTKSLEGLMRMSGVEGPEEEAPEERDEADKPKSSDAVREFFEAGHSGDYEGADKALRSLHAAYMSETGPEGDEEEEGETEPEEDDEDEE